MKIGTDKLDSKYIRFCFGLTFGCLIVDAAGFEGRLMCDGAMS